MRQDIQAAVMAPPPASCPPPLVALDAALRSGPTATAALERWCLRQGLRPTARIRVEVAASWNDPGTPELRAQLRLMPGEQLCHRRVWLYCEDLPLSCAEAWYAPAHLGAEMNQALEESDRPLGEVVAPLKPWRRLLAARLIWPAEPAEIDGRRSSAILEHRALLMAGDGRVLAAVHELYQQGLLPGGMPSATLASSA
jgi:chorismate-pyruvate lyase